MRTFLWAAIILLASTANAADKSSGCGLGWYVLKENTLVSSFFRATTNGLFFNNTFGMTSGTSNCAKHDFVDKDKKSLHFLEANYHNLMVEAAIGAGEHLDGFSQSFGCQKAEMSSFKQMLRTRHADFFTLAPERSSVDLWFAIKEAIRNHPVLFQGCSVV